MRLTPAVRGLVATSLSVALAACAGDPPEGLAPTPVGSGPRVVWDLEAKPLPEIPLPNDRALRLDATSPTGKRLNISTEAPTEVEAQLRRRAARLDGFGTFAPITVRFERELDLTDLAARQRDNDDFADDAVLVVDVTPGSPTYGQAQRLDFGRGAFPAGVMDPHFYFAHDPRDGASNLLFETVEEDANANGRLDPGEDTDGDGVLDHPNVLPKDGNPWDDLLVWYERETHTLILRPMVPLREATRYAVVLTNRLRGEDGQPVRSPFDFVNDFDQSKDLGALPEVLRAYGMGLGDVAFAWTFTTGSVTLDLRTVRAGLYGSGPLARLSAELPATATLDVVRSDDKGSPYVLKGADLAPVAYVIGPAFGLSQGAQAALVKSFDYIDHVVFGRYPSPSFLVDHDGLATPDNPQNDDEAWDLDPVTGRAVYAAAEVSFLCVIPKARPGMTQPFPVVLHTTGTAVPKVGALAYAGWHARQGLATCAIDPFGHGLDIPPEGEGLSEAALAPLVEQLGFGPILPVLEGRRARDLDNDGLADSGGDFWSSDPFHSRDTVRQTVVDWMQLVRVLRSFGRPLQDGEAGPGPVLGDWDGDGTPDVGTEAGHYSAWGISLGGIVTGVLAGVEPKLEAAVPQSGGAGLIDIAMRSTQPGVPETVVMGTWGPLFVGEPGEAGTDVKALLPHFDRVDYVTVGNLSGVASGDRVTLTNLRSGEHATAWVGPGGAFRLGVAADALSPSKLKAMLRLQPLEPGFAPAPLGDTLQAGDPLELVVEAPDGTVRGRLTTFDRDVTWANVVWPKGQPLVAMTRGLGRARQTPQFRLLAAIAQTVVDPADPASYAPHYFTEPFEYPYDPGAAPGCNVLDLATVGDPNVPIATAISLARAAGIVGDDAMKALVEGGVVEGLWRLGRFRKDGSGPHAFDPAFDPKAQGDDAVLFDIDDLDGGADGFGAPSPATPLRATLDTPLGGKAGLRIAYIQPHGSHGITPPDLGKPWPVEMYAINMMTRYLLTGGAELIDDACLADGSCSFIPKDDAE